MRRRLLPLLVCLIAVASIALEAQTKKRPRIPSRGGTVAVNQAPSIALVTYTAGVGTTSTTASGVAADDLAVSSVTCTVNTGASCTVAQPYTAWTATIGATVGLSVGANVVTFTATDGSGLTAQTQATITYTVPPDGGIPTLTITTNSGLPFTTASATATLNGTATDNVAVTSTRCRISGGTNFTGGGTMGATSVNWSNSGKVPLAIGDNTVLCEALDAAGNVSTAASIVITRVTDTGAPTITILSMGSNGSAIVDGGTTNSNDLDFVYSATDDVSVFEVRVTDSTTHALQGYAKEGPRKWSQSHGTACPLVDSTSFASSHDCFGGTANNNKLKTGTNTYCLEVFDANYAHWGSACATITYIQPTVEIITFGMPPARTSNTYSFHLRGQGGTGVFHWDNGSGGSSLGAGACTGLSITDSADDLGIIDGLVSGTPTTTGTCSVGWHFCDDSSGGASRCASGTLSLTVQAGALVDPFAHFEVMNARSEKVYAARLTTSGEVTNILPGQTASPYWAATSDGAEVSMPTKPPSPGASESLIDQGRIKTTHMSPNGPYNTGTVHIAYQFKYHRSALSYSCTGGAINSTFEPAYSHKLFQAAMGRTGDTSVEGDINIEMQSLYGKNGYFCNRAAAFSARIYNNQQNPNPTGVLAGANGGAPPTPCGIVGCAANQSYEFKPEVWYLVVIELRLNQAAAAFTDWNAYCACTLSAGTYHMLSISVWGENDTTPTYIAYRYPVDLYGKADKSDVPYTQFHAFYAPEGNSSDKPGAISGTFKFKVRNVAILHNYSTADMLTDTNLNVRPARAVN